MSDCKHQAKVSAWQQEAKFSGSFESTFKLSLLRNYVSATEL
jgi:hypothetical protein